ncbi:hypothetical protein [uncultured Nitrosomonas sp.]|uniref:hypothetical protein n=1 Tax=uncultured Nitrosomonas sp. TaxID=156424 RepID=UPI0025DA217E|nr:hypothetical protein [uncultured Nitrosomonas sp.]
MASDWNRTRNKRGHHDEDISAEGLPTSKFQSKIRYLIKHRAASSEELNPEEIKEWLKNRSSRSVQNHNFVVDSLTVPGTATHYAKM